ncbi:glycosyltransferase family 4 protein [Nanoarchaeota archaeon]
MKLLIASDTALPRRDGVSRYLSEIIPRLKDYYEITIVWPDYGEHILTGVKTVRIPLADKNWGELTPARFDYKTIYNEVKKADVVFSQALGPVGMCTYRAARKLKKKIVGYIHLIEWDFWVKYRGTKFMKGFMKGMIKLGTRHIYNRYDLLLAPSVGTADLLQHNHINTPKRIVHLGVDANKFKPGSNNELKAKLGFKKNDIIIGYHGRLSREKDLTTLLRAFTRLRSKNKNVGLLIVGDGLKELEKMFSNQTKVVHVPAQKNVQQYLHIMDIYCLPSLTETTSLSTLEAMLCGLPVVVTETGLVRDYVVDNYNGMFIPMQKPVALFKKLEYLTENPEVRKKLGTNARNDIKEQFDWDLTAYNINQAIEEVME